MNALVPISANSNVEAYRESTEAADICKAIVLATASNIQGRKYVAVEGWQAIARAHGCAVSARGVERVDGGMRAIGDVIRMSDGVVISSAEGFVGEDEPTWYGGDNGRGKQLPKRAEYAIRAMAQTRAMSRSCRSAFAHVVVMMNAGLATTPAEEVPSEGFDRETGEVIDLHPEPAPREKLEGKHEGKHALKTALRELSGKLATAPAAAALEALVEEYGEDMAQCRRYLPAWWSGDGTPEKRGISGNLEDARARVKADSGFLSDMLDSMTATQTAAALAKWMAAQERAIDTLDEVDRDRFDKAVEAHESALMLVATANA